MGEDSLQPDVVSMRPFVPAKDIETSLRFYGDLGFTIDRLSDGLAAISYGPFGFLLQQYDVEGFAGNFMMHMMVNDLDGWWKRIEALELTGKYSGWKPRPPAMQPWGLVVAYVADPSGVLWHFAQKRA